MDSWCILPHLHTLSLTHTHTHTHACMHHTYTHSLTHTHTHMHASYLHTLSLTHTHTHTHTCMHHTYTHSHLHTHTHTHTHMHASLVHMCPWIKSRQPYKVCVCMCDLVVKIILIYFTEHRFKFLMIISGRPMTVCLLLANSSTTATLFRNSFAHRRSVVSVQSPPPRTTSSSMTRPHKTRAITVRLDGQKSKSCTIHHTVLTLHLQLPDLSSSWKMHWQRESFLCPRHLQRGESRVENPWRRILQRIFWLAQVLASL